MTASTIDAPPALPTPCGPLSSVVCDRLGLPPADVGDIPPPAGSTDAYRIDLQLALYVCYELHYRGFAAVDAGWEWHPGLLRFRAELERIFLDAVRGDVDSVPGPARAVEAMDALSVEPVHGAGLSWRLRDTGSWQQMREYFVHRSLYHLKEGDPHAFAIPRLTGQAKASFVAVEFDEYGAGSGPRLHQQLFADLMSAADLDPGYLGYLEAVPAESLATVNLMSLFGLHRRWRGAAVGHFASTEITSPPGSQRMVAGLRRLDAPEACVAFYREHVEADAVHEQVVRSDVVGDLLNSEPQLEPDVVFGIRAHDAVETRLSAAMTEAWDAGRSSLRRPLSEPPSRSEQS